MAPWTVPFRGGGAVASPAKNRVFAIGAPSFFGALAPPTSEKL